MTSKLSQFLFGLHLLLSACILAQQDAPSVEWKINDYPHKFPVSPIVIPTTSDPFYQPGHSVRDYTNEFPSHKTGEDWWYSVTPATVQNQGYYVCGYATWVNFQIDEAPAGGCKTHDIGQPDLQRPVLPNETHSTKLGTVGYYDKKGNMVWCKPYLPGAEGAYSCKEDLDGNIIITGWTNSTRDINGNSILFNPQSGNSGDDLDALNLCSSNNSKAFVAKISPNGTLIWAHTYSMYNLGTSGISNNQIVGMNTLGYDLIIDQSGNYVIVGEQYSRFENTRSIFLLKIDPNGQILNRSELSLLNHNTVPRSISLYNNEILVGGYAEEIGGRTHGFVAKFDANLVPLTAGNFGHNSKLATFYNSSGINDLNVGLIWIENLDNGNGVSSNNLVSDTKKLATGNIAVVSIEDCTNCKFSGQNFGIGNLRVYNSNGSGL